MAGGSLTPPFSALPLPLLTSFPLPLPSPPLPSLSSPASPRLILNSL